MHDDTPTLPERDPEALWWFDTIRNAIWEAECAFKRVPANVPSVRYDYSWLVGGVAAFQSAKTYRTVHAHDFEQRVEHEKYRAFTVSVDLHPAVRAVLGAGWRPTGKPMTTVVLEWPSVSDDGMRLAYFQSDQKIDRNLRTVTSAEKYIKARWPYLPDHMIRDFVARAAIKEPMILHAQKDIVRGVQQGPTSCMKWSNEDGSEDWVADWAHHPYAAYHPDFGWRLAVKPAPEGSSVKYAARALVLHESCGPWQEGETLQGAMFVRSYKHVPNGYSVSDEALESWLRHMGVKKVNGWPDGARLAAVNSIDSFSRNVFPYIDGDNNRVYENNFGGYTIDDAKGNLGCRNTDGSADGDELYECSCCGRTHSDQEGGLYVGRYEDTWVGECCVDSYTYVYGRRGDRYYIYNDEVVEVSGEYYDCNYLEDNNIVELCDGDYAHENNAFCCPFDDEWYVYDDGVDTIDEGWVHRSHAWQCEGSGDWYSTNTDPVFVDGNTYHPDCVPDEDEDPDDPEFTNFYDKPEGSISNELQEQLDLSPCDHVAVAGPEPIRYYRNRVCWHLVYRVVDERVEYLTTDREGDTWDLNYTRTPSELRGPSFFPVASPDERIYRHVATDRLYRAGERRIDVLHPNTASWQLDVGEPNDWLTDPQYHYRNVSHTRPELETA